MLIFSYVCAYVNIRAFCLSDIKGWSLGNMKVSVIIPVYNVVSYIERCLDSLWAQTIDELEIILIDDHGQDDSIAIARKWAEEILLQGQSGKRSVVFTETPCNSGPGEARNVGLQIATGEYVAFLDADDWVEPTMYSTLYAAAKAEQAEISSSAAILDYPDGSHREMHNPHVGNGDVTRNMRSELLKHFVSNFTTCIFKREWLITHAIHFPVGRSGEDSCFMGMCYLMVERIAQSEDLFYHYVIHEDSISHGRHVWRGREKRQAFGVLIDFAREMGLLKQYRKELYLIYIKKALLTPIKEYLN